jgi:predicted dehydrogenase
MVDVCVPTFLHEEYAVRALNAGVAVLCEKPFSLTAESAEAMAAASRASGAPFMIAQVLRFWPEYVAIAEAWRAGELGDEVMASAVRLSQMPTWSDWYKDPALSGGGALDIHAHDIDVLVHLFGRVRKLHAVGWKNDRGAWNHVVSSLEFENGLRAVAEGSIEITPGYPFTMGLRLVGTKATLDFHLTAGANLDEMVDNPTTLWRYEAGAEPVPVAVSSDDAYQREIAYFVDRLQRGEPTDTVPVSESLHVLDVLLAIRRSLESGQVVRL